MRTHPTKILSGILIAVYLSTTILSEVVRATPPQLNPLSFPASQHEPKRGINPETGKVSFIGAGDPINVHGVSDVKGLTVQERAMGMAIVYGKEFGLKNPSQELKLLKSKKDNNGKDVVHYRQTYKDVPVLAAEMIVNTNANGELLSISGEVSPDLTLDTKPAIKADEARQTALTEIAALHKIEEEELGSTDPELWIFDESLLTASTRPVELVWRMEVTAKDAIQPIREMVLVNAQTGHMSFHFNQVDTEDSGHKASQAGFERRQALPVTAASQIQYVDLVVDEARGQLYGADKSGNKIDVISMSDLSIATSYLLVSGALPTGIDLSSDGNELAVAQSGLSRVKFINLTDGTMSETPAVLSGSNTKVTDVLYGRTGILYALSSNGLHVINTTVVPHAEDGAQYVPGNSSSYSERFGAISSDQNTLFYITGTCCSGYNSLYKFDISNGLAKPVEANHTYLYGSGSRTNLRLSLINDNTLITSFGTIYNTSTFVPIAKNGQISSPAIALPGRSFYVTSYDNTSGADLLYFFDGQNSYKISSLATVISGTPGALTVTSDGDVLFVSSSGGMTKFNIGTTAPGTPISLPQSLHQYRDFTFDMPRGVVYGTDAANRVDVIDQNTGNVLNSYLLPNGANPRGIDLSPDGNELAVALNGLETVLFMNSQTGAEIARVNPKIDLSIYYENLPYDVIYGRAGRLYSNGNDKIQVIDTVSHTWLSRAAVSSSGEMALTTDKKYLYDNGSFSDVYIYDVQTDNITKIYQGPLGVLSASKFAMIPDGSKVFASSGQVWSGDVQEQLGMLEGGGGKLIKFLPNLNVVALNTSVTGGDVIRFISSVNYRLLSTYGPISNGSISEMESAPDGSRLFMNINNTIKVLNLDPSLPMSISVQSGSAQSVQVSTSFQNPLKVKVLNILGNPVPDAAVTFQSPASGASVTFADTHSNITSVNTDANGIATSPLFSANSVAGTYTVQASAQNLNPSISFQLTNLASVNCTLAVGSSSATLFQPYKQYRCGKTAYGVASGDFNTDGRKDVAISTSDDLLLIYLQDTSGNLSTQPRVYAGSGSSILSVGDLNHDGRDDIVIPGGTEIRIFFQKGDGTFPYPVTYSTGYTAGALAVGDVNNDSLPDIVVNLGSNSIGVFTQKQDGTLNPIVTYPSLGSGEIAIGDVNGDGLNDVISMNGQSSNQLQIFIQNNNVLNAYFSTGLTGCSYSCNGGGIGVGDVTGDGRADIVMSYGGNRPYSYIAVFAQDANGNLLPPVTYSSYDIPNPVEIADVNSDNLSDIIALHSGWSKAGAYLQQSNGAISTESLYQIPYKSWYYALDLNISDVNADGLPDVLVADGQGLVILYRNPAIPPTAMPTFTPGPGPTRTPGPTSTLGPSPTPVPPASTGSRRTYTASGGSTLPGTFLCDQNQSLCTNGVDSDADQAHQYAADTFVFYNTHHGRNSFDNQGSTIISTVHYGMGYENAFWDGYQMVYGDGMTADDVVGHELTHGVTQYTSNLIYSYQSGAINESFSDVWGEFIDQTNGSGDDSPSVKWLMGEDLSLGVIRSMSNPPVYGHPDKMSSYYYYTGSGDNGGVHINSGVNNKAAYLMTEGGTFNGRTIVGIGLNKTAAVYYEAQVYHLTMGANYNDLYYALLQACQNLIGGADGITENDCDQVRLAAEAVEMVPTYPLPTVTATVATWWPSTPTATVTIATWWPSTPTVTASRTATASPTGTATKTPTRVPTYDPTMIPAGGLLRVSVDSGAEQGNHDSYFPAISADGRYIVFNSYASNLVVGDTNGASDIFVHDMQTSLTTRVSVDSNGIQGNGHSYRPVVSADGRYIAFDSDGSNLVPGDNNGNSDVFVHDRQTGVTTRVSVRSDGLEGYGTSVYPSISADGRYIAFYSSAANLAANDTNLANDIFLHDRQTGETRRVSAALDGTQANHDSRYPSISADGRYLAFESEATNLIPGDTNGVMDVFRYDSLTGQILRVSVDSYERQANGHSGSPSISADGNFIAFESDATNLVSGDTNADKDIFLYDTSTGTTTRVSVDSNGLQANISSYAPFISADGRYIAFDSGAENLVPGDSNRQIDAFVHDRELGKTTRFSVSSIYGEGNGHSDQIVVSADGQFLAFTSRATNLVPYDTNLGMDVFVYRQTILPFPLTPAPTSTITPSSTSTATAVGTPTRAPTVAPAFYARTTTGVFRPSNGLLYLKNTNDTGFADAALNYGLPGDYPVVGDWDGDGDATIGVYRRGKFYLRNSNTLGFADLVFAFGTPGDQPIAGDWDGDGIDTIGVYRPSNGLFLLRNSNSAGDAEMSFYLGNVGDVGIAGDWDGDGKDTTGVFRPSNGIIFLKNTNETGFADLALNYGIPGDKPVTGDWDNDGINTIGVYRNGQFLLRNSNTVGFADIVFGLGNPGDMPIAGNWDGIP